MITVVLHERCTSVVLHVRCTCVILPLRHLCSRVLYTWVQPLCGKTLIDIVSASVAYSSWPRSHRPPRPHHGMSSPAHIQETDNRLIRLQAHCQITHMRGITEALSESLSPLADLYLMSPRMGLWPMTTRAIAAPLSRPYLTPIRHMTPVHLTPAEQAIAAAEAAGGGTVFFPPGRFLMSEVVGTQDSLMITGAHVVLQGSGSGGPDATELFFKGAFLLCARTLCSPTHGVRS